MNLNKKELKEKLVKCGLCVDNEYLDNYCDIILKNQFTPQERFKTQKHHIIPRFYYKYNNIKCDDSEDNVVTLPFREHIIAHCYLEFCVGLSVYKAKNYWAIIRLSHSKPSFKDLEEALKDDVRLDEMLKKLHYMPLFTKEHRKRLSDSMRGNHNFGTGDTRSIGVGCILDTGEKFEFHSMRDAGKWWFNTFHPFGEHYAECVFQRKIKKSIKGEKITHTKAYDSSTKHPEGVNTVEITNIKWYRISQVGGDVGEKVD